MNEYGLEDNTFINSLVGEGTTFNGELQLDGLLRIDGDFIGTIRTPGTVLIGKSGRVESTIEGGTIVIGGVVKGNVIAGEKVVILSTGMLIGNVTAPRLIIEEGVLLNGNCDIRTEQQQVSLESEVPAGEESGSTTDKTDPEEPEDAAVKAGAEDSTRWKE